jgi:DNA-binding transcriptional LysR family regulator
MIVATGSSGTIIRQVEPGELDIGLVTLPVAVSRALSVTRLLTDPLVALIPQSMADANETIGVAQLSALPLILCEQTGSTRALIDGWFRRSGVTPVPAMQLDSVESIKVLVSGGLGASIIPLMSQAPSFAASALGWSAIWPWSSGGRRSSTADCAW